MCCDDLWIEYYATKSQKLRDVLIVKYLHLVKSIGTLMHRKMPSIVDKNDIISSGVVGLIKAVELFDPGKGFKFETYATFKIRGAVLDEIRNLDWVPKTVRAKARMLLNTRSRLEASLGRLPYDHEMCRALKLSINEYDDLVSESAPVVVVNFEWPLNSRDDSVTIEETVASDTGKSPFNVLYYKEVRSLVEGVLKKMTDIEQGVFKLYTFEDLNMREIGEVFGLSESRICQIYSKILLNLRSNLRKEFFKLI